MVEVCACLPASLLLFLTSCAHDLPSGSELACRAGTTTTSTTARPTAATTTRIFRCPADHLADRVLPCFTGSTEDAHSCVRLTKPWLSTWLTSACGMRSTCRCFRCQTRCSPASTRRTTRRRWWWTGSASASSPTSTSPSCRCCWWRALVRPPSVLAVVYHAP